MNARPNQRFTTPEQLIDAGLPAPERLAELKAVAARYATASPPPSPRSIEPGDRRSDRAPIRSRPRELGRDPAESADPIGDDLKSPVKGLVHRYPDRVLIKLVAVCAVYCRFCFRRERVGPGRAR